MKNNLEQLNKIREFVKEKIEENYFPILEGTSVTSVAEVSRATGLPPHLVFKLLLVSDTKIQNLKIDLKRPILPKKRDKCAAKIWNEGQRYQRRGPYEQSPRPTRKRIKSLIENVELGRTKLTLNKLKEITPIDKEQLKRALRFVSKAEFVNMKPKDKFFDILCKETRFPIKNLDILRSKIQTAVLENRQFRLGCFTCLSITSDNKNNWPAVRVVPDGEIRMLLPKIKQRTISLVNTLNKTGFDFRYELILANTDLRDIYQIPFGQELEIEQTLNRIKRENNNLPVILWSDIENSPPSLERLQCDIDQGAIIAGTTRRIDYYKQKGFTLTADLENYARECSKRLLESYARQGPIIEKYYDCLIIADPDPLRFGIQQSVLAPSLPIWYPYPG